MTQVQLLTLINKLQLTLSKAKDALENTYLPAYVFLHYIEEETGVDISQADNKLG